jgi:tRNA G18 (ribose-2'-O)-methylase SpoU
MFTPNARPVKGAPPTAPTGPSGLGQTATVAVIRIDDAGDRRLADYVELSDPAARRRRERDELFVAEGVTAIERLLASDHDVRSVLLTPKAHARLAGALAGLDAPVYVAAPAVLHATVGFSLHRGAVAAADRRPLPELAEVLRPARRVVVLEGLNDPENLGAVARSARALGIDAAVLDPTCIDPYYRRTVRVSMGEILFLPTARAAHWPSDLEQVRAAGFELWALSPDADGEDLWSLAVPDRVAVLLGAEGPGLSPAALAAADRRVRIPIRAGVDSLNVGHAAAVTFAALDRPPPVS